MYISLMQNAALLLALTAIYGLITRMRRGGEVWAGTLAGLLFGGVAVAGMLMPFKYAPGIIYDGRSIVMAMAGLFGGWGTAAVSMVVAGAYRAYLGGPGIWAGLATIIGCAMLGLAFRRAYGNQPERPGILSLYGFGIIVHIVMLACQLLLIPWPTGLAVISRIWQPILLIFPAATVLLGIFLGNEERRIQTERKLSASKDLLHETQQISKIGGWEYDIEKKRITWTDEVFRIHELPPNYDPNSIQSDFQFYAPEARKTIETAFYNAVERGGPYDLTLPFITAKGNNLWVRTIGKAELRDGKPVRFIGTIMDITERKRVEEEIKRLNVELEQRVRERTTQLESANKELENEITERKKKEKKIKRQNILLEGINWIVRAALTVKTEEELCRQSLAIAEELTGSKFGFIHELNEAGSMDSLTLSDPGWEVSRMPHTDAAILLKNIPVRGIYSEAIRKGISVIVNDPASHPDRVGLPEGHPTLTAFLGVPLKKGDKVIGLIGLANKESGYDTDDQQSLEIISIAFVEALTRLRSENLIKTLNKELQQNMDEVSDANRELEAFSYSISHDLRAPLRAIDGYSRFVLEDYAEKLDNEGRRLLNIIRTNTQKMDRLITDILALSRVSRTEMKSLRIDMTTLVNSIYHELALTEIQGKFVFSVSALPDAFGDPTLIRQVWANLISNAIKYTLPKEERRIEIGGRVENDMNVYYIQDTGVGFNPDYTHKLFGLFQRLHKAEEFEGTGVGLAIVQRIILRHGGKVWAEGKVNEGATFSFSMPIKEKEKR